MGKILEIEFLNIRGCNIKKLFVLFILFQISTSLSAFAQTPKSYEYDLIRAELSVLKDKNSPQYKKTKQKLERYISQNKIDYSTQARIEDVERLIQEQKYNSAIYELNDPSKTRGRSITFTKYSEWIYPSNFAYPMPKAFMWYPYPELTKDSLNTWIYR